MACINSANVGSGNYSTQCNELRAYATYSGTAGTVETAAYAGTFPADEPYDTATAILNIAHHPASASVTNLFNLQGPSANAVYRPNLASAPTNWTVTLAFTGGGLGAEITSATYTEPFNIAIDKSGNVYTTNYVGNSLNIFSPLGVPASASGFTGNGLNGPFGVSIDPVSSNLWIPNHLTNSVSEFTVAGAAVSGSPFATTATSKTNGTSVDGAGNVWVTNVAGSNFNLQKLSSSGVQLATATGNGLTTPYGIAFQPTISGTPGNTWISDEGGNKSIFTNADTAVSTSATNVKFPEGIAIDSHGNVCPLITSLEGWEVTSADAAVGQFSPSPTAQASESYSAVAIDGANNVWSTATAAKVVLEINSAGTNLSGVGYAPANGSTPDPVAIDTSGNVWYSTLAGTPLYEIIGAAVPVVMPLSYAVANNLLGTRP